jgi:hypothetical protein
LIEEIASWLRRENSYPKVPGGRRMMSEFTLFQKKLPKICSARGLEPAELTFGDYAEMVVEYLAATA